MTNKQKSTQNDGNQKKITLEQLNKSESEYKKFKEDLESLSGEVKDNADGDVKSRAEDLNKAAIAKCDEITKMIESVEKNVNLYSDAVKQKVEKLKTTIEGLQKEIADLYNQIIESLKSVTTGASSSASATMESGTSSKTESSSSDKNWFQKAWGWIGDQWNDVWDKEKREDDKLKNILRAAGFTVSIVGIPALIWKGMKSLFSKKGKDSESEDKERKDSKSEDKEESSKKSKKKSFGNSGFGKFLKWLSFGLGTGFGVYYLGKNFGGSEGAVENTVDKKEDENKNENKNENEKTDDKKSENVNGNSENSGDKQPESKEKEPKDSDIVSVKTYIPSIILDMRYATTNNFTGQKIYDSADAKLRYGTVKKLKIAQEALIEKGYSIKIWDAYRPNSAQKKLRKIRPDEALVAMPYDEKTKKNGSNHTRGNAVDITLVKKDGTEISMPSEFDDSNKEKVNRNYFDLGSTEKENALILENAMRDADFIPYPGERWHFTDKKQYPFEIGD